MKLTDLQLEHYGIYEDVSWQPPDTGLCVIMGENESGKTTMLSFIRDMLFGYRRGRRKGRKGNMMICRDNGKTYRIYRNEGETKVLDDRLVDLGKEPAQLWWHGLDRHTYEHVFAIGLEDLQGAELLAKDEVRSRFLSIQGGELLADAQTTLRADMEELLISSPQGKRKINVLLGTLAAADVAVNAFANQESDFADIQKELKEVSAEIEKTEAAIRALDVRDRTLDKQLGAWKYYEEGLETKRKLDLCAQIHSFPEDGAVRWSNLMTRMARIKEERDELMVKMAPLAPQQEADVKPWEPQRQEIAALALEVSRWREWQAEWEAKKEALEVWEEEYRNLSSGYANWAGIDTNRLTNVDWAVGRELAGRVCQRDNELHYWRNDEPLVEEVSEEAIVVPQVATEDELATLDRSCQDMLRLVRERNHLQEEIDWLREQPEKRYSAFFWIGFIVVIAAAVVMYFFYTGRAGVNAPYLSAALVLISLACFWLNYRKSHQNKYRLLKLNERIGVIQESVVTLDDQLQMGIPQTDSEMAHFAGEIERIRHEFYRYQAKVQAQSWQEESRRRQIEVHAQWQERGQKLHQDRELTIADWRQWVRDQGLPDTDPAHIETLQREWQSLFTARGRGEILRIQQEKIKTKMDQLYNRTRILIECCGLTMEPSPFAIETIANGYREQMLAWQTAKEKNAQYADLAREKAVLDERWTLCENEMKALFALVNAKDAQEFADKVTAYEQCDQLRQNYERIRQNLRLYAGSEVEFERLWRQLETGEYDKWLQRRDQYERELKENRVRQMELQQRQGALRNELQRLIEDDSLAKALQQRSAIRAELDAELDRYIACVAIDGVLETARTHYDGDGRPQVIERAGQYLQAMTSGRYTLVMDAEGKVQTVDTAHDLKEADMWSSGTGDQVYLSLRLSLALAFGERSEEMPIVLDDIFVRFDETRQRETLRFLLEFARTRQVFLFTCHAHTAEMAKEIDTQQRGHYYHLRSGKIHHA